jgi:glycosyltransferase involved in cell wall biosynthesis
MGTQEKVLKEFAGSLSLFGEILFVGSLSNEDMIEMDSTKKILLMASSQEGFPMAIAEALSVGLPVITTDTGDISRFIKNNENGILLPIAFSDEQYIEGIKLILSDYRRFSENALASSVVFKAENVAKSLINDILKVTSRR